MQFTRWSKNRESDEADICKRFLEEFNQGIAYRKRLGKRVGQVEETTSERAAEM